MRVFKPTLNEACAVNQDNAAIDGQEVVRVADLVAHLNNRINRLDDNYLYERQAITELKVLLAGLS